MNADILLRVCLLFMATKYRVVGKAPPRKPRRLSAGEIPYDAFWLWEDIQTLDLVLDLVAKLHDRNFVSAGEPDWNAGVWNAQKTLRRLKFILGSLQTIAEEKLRYEFLAGARPTRRPRRQTAGDIWRILKDSLDKDAGN